jgi:hypothetical protein
MENYSKLTRQQKIEISFFVIKFKLNIAEKFSIKTGNLTGANERIRFIKLSILTTEFRKNLIEKYALS